MAELKTRVTRASVGAFLEKIADETRRADCNTLVRIMKRVTRCEPKMWGSSIVGFGSGHYRYASGHEGDCPLVGFSPRKRDLTLYIWSCFEKDAPVLRKLGKCRAGKACLYVKRLADIDLEELEKLIARSVLMTKQRFRQA